MSDILFLIVVIMVILALAGISMGIGSLFGRRFGDYDADIEELGIRSDQHDEMFASMEHRLSEIEKNVVLAEYDHYRKEIKK